jgi:uncharacterized membrane protein YraQ (UPF0718 family)/copper chaperone CopZ
VESGYAIVLAFLLSIWETLREMAPYILFGFFVAGVLSVLIEPELVERHLGGRGFGQVAKAALFGVPLPLCSCGVIPVAASLRRHGAGAGATTSFLISTPQTGVDSIMVTLSLLGPVFAVFRPVISFISGLIGGSLASIFGSEDTAREATRPVCDGGCGAHDARGNAFLRMMRYGFVTLPRDLNRALLIGVAVAGLIAALVPDDFFAAYLGGGIVSMLVMMAVGIPVYVCATASVPIAAVLIAKGVSPGAALVFLMTGPATNAATITTVWRIMGRRTAAIYLATVAVCAIAAGLMLDYLYEAASVPVVAAMPRMIPGAVKTASAVVLLGVLIGAFFWRTKVGTEVMSEDTTEKLKLAIEGMTCDHCARSIRRALMETPGVVSAEVDFKKGVAVVTGSGIDLSRISAAVEELGYTFVGSETLESRP